MTAQTASADGQQGSGNGASIESSAGLADQQDSHRAANVTPEKLRLAFRQKASDARTSGASHFAVCIQSGELEFHHVAGQNRQFYAMFGDGAMFVESTQIAALTRQDLEGFRQTLSDKGELETKLATVIDQGLEAIDQAQKSYYQLKRERVRNLWQAARRNE